MQRILYGVRKRDFQKYNFLVFMKLFTTKTKKEHENTLYEKKKFSSVFERLSYKKAKTHPLWKNIII